MPSKPTLAAGRLPSVAQRQARSKPILEALEPWLRAKLERGVIWPASTVDPRDFGCGERI
jgi:hypothetical protein